MNRFDYRKQMRVEEQVIEKISTRQIAFLENGCEPMLKASIN